MNALILLAVLAAQPDNPISPEPTGLTAQQQVDLAESWETYLKERYVALEPKDRPRTENDWSDFLKEKYEATREFSLFDGSRVDMLNSKYAIEVDSAANTLKWAEAVGQSLWYATMTNREPAIILLVPISPKARHTDNAELAEKRRSVKSNIHKAVTVCQRAGITLYLEETFRYIQDAAPAPIKVVDSEESPGPGGEDGRFDTPYKGVTREAPTLERDELDRNLGTGEVLGPDIDEGAQSSTYIWGGPALVVVRVWGLERRKRAAH